MMKTSKFKEALGYYFSIFSKKEEDPYEGLMTVKERKRQSSKKFRVRFFGSLIALPIIFSIIYVVFKSFIIYYQQEDETLDEKKNKPLPKMSMEINGFTTWQNKTDEDLKSVKIELGKTNANIKELSEVTLRSTKEQKENFQNLKEEMLQSAKQVSEDLMQRVMKVEKGNVEALEKINSDVQARLSKKDSEFAKKLSDLKVAKNNTPIKLNINELPSVSDLTKKKKNVAPTSNNKVAKEDKREFVKEEEIIEYEEVEEDYEVETYAFSTLDEINEALDEQNKEKELPSFFLMPGFAKAVIVAGADAPTMSTGTTDPKRVWLSIISEQFIANNGTANFKDCLLSGIAKGRIVNGRARINIDTMSCEMTSPDGQKYKINQPIKGLVYGEDGKGGVKGRLVSKEGEIIKRGIPLAAIEGAISTLSKTRNYILPTGGSTSTEDANPLTEFATGGANTGSKILQKFSEYYLKILEELTPYVEVRAKRVVTVAFEGGETLKIQKYDPMDINHFYNEESNEEFNY